MSDKNKAADALVLQGLNLYREGKMEQALMFWRKALELQPLHPRASKYIQEAHPSVSYEELVEDTTCRIDTSTLKEQLDASRDKPVLEAMDQSGSPQEFKDVATAPISDEMLEQQLAESWVDSPADDLEITVSSQKEGRNSKTTSTSLKPLKERETSPPRAPKAPPPPIKTEPAPVLEFVVGEPEDTIALDEYQERHSTPLPAPGEDDFTITVMEEEPEQRQSPTANEEEDDDFTITVDVEER